MSSPTSVLTSVGAFRRPFTFNPDEPRDDHGKWTDGGGEGQSPASQASRAVADGYKAGAGLRVAGVEEMGHVWDSMGLKPDDAKAFVAAEVADDMKSSTEDLRAAVAASTRMDIGEMSREDLTSNMVQTWATSANDSFPMSLALQEAARREFGLGDAAGWDLSKLGEDRRARYQDLVDNHMPVLRDFVRAQYDSTQRFLAGQNIEAVSLYRGIGFDKGAPLPDWAQRAFNDHYDFTTGRGHVELADPALRPMSSFSYSPGIARGFSYGGQDQVLLHADVPAKDILACPFSGVGCLREGEMVVLGRLPSLDAELQSTRRSGPFAQRPIPARLPVVPGAVLNDERDEDWIKTQGWDLPTKLPDFLAAIAPMSVAEFMRLPAAEAMPARLRAQIEAKK